MDQRSATSTDCAPCQHALECGWFGHSIPPGYTHDRDSHRTFPGSQRWGSCARCGELFAGVVAFNLHQRHDADGNYTEGSLCSFALAVRTHGGDLPDVWVVSARRSLFLIPSYWDDGFHWAREAPDFAVTFSGGEEVRGGE